MPSKPLYVVQKHQARALHYDLRLEKDGVLKSWAVPKGIPEKAGIRHLAVQVGDHSLDYAAFEGTIPEGQYGAGIVEIWDSGTFEERSWRERKIVVDISGKRIKGEYVLVRLKPKPGEEDKNWILFRKGND